MEFLARRLPLLLAVTAALALPSILSAQRERLPFDDVPIVERRWPNAKKTSTSIRYVVNDPGDEKGPTPQPGMYIEALYKGMLLNGKIFDEVRDPKRPLKMRLGRHMLIEGWEQILPMMHRGSKWTIIVPAELAYGSRGRPPDIPSEATLVFELELLNFGPN